MKLIKSVNLYLGRVSILYGKNRNPKEMLNNGDSSMCLSLLYAIIVVSQDVFLQAPQEMNEIDYVECENDHRDDYNKT
jgi:hypothetical protein